MSKTRVYELARELEIESKILLAQIKSLGIDVASHQSTLTDLQAHDIRKALGKVVEEDSSPKVVIRRRRIAGRSGDSSGEAESAESTENNRDLQRTSQDPDKGARSGEQHRGESAGGVGTLEAKSQSEAVSAEAASIVSKDDKPTMSDEERQRELGLTPLVYRPASPRAPKETVSANSEDSQLISKSEIDSPKNLESASADNTASISVEPAVSESAEPVRADSSSVAVDKSSQSRSSSGATIVRKAVPGEVTGSTKEPVKSKRPADNGRPGTLDRNVPSQHAGDSTSRGGRQNLSAAQQSPVWKANPEVGEGRIKGPKSKVVSREEDESTEIRKPLIKPKREVVNTRVLINLATDKEDGAFDLETRKRTVFTPGLSSRRRDVKKRKDLKKTNITTPRAAYRVVRMGDQITVAELGKQLGVKGSELIKKLMLQGVMVTINQAIDFDSAILIATDYGFEVETNKVTVGDIIAKDTSPQKSAEEKSERAPIVTIMGHVDHGKTSILDAIRKARVAEGESGGITQHIGAYSVLTQGNKRISFLDTPGHEAFSSMRQRGAMVTDIVVLVVAADDGVKPQTVEAISHAKAANVPMIVAINKIDKKNINLDRVYNELMEQGIQSEEWGGETQFVKVSALNGTGLDNLLDAISLQAEVLELKASFTGPAQGVVVEAHLDQLRGPVATVIVQNGQARIGDIIVAGSTYGKIRSMQADDGTKLESAGPSLPVQIVGLESVPMAGDVFNAVSNEKFAREIADLRKVETSNLMSKSSGVTLETLLGRVASGERFEVPLILKGDTQGSIEAMSQSLGKINTDRVQNRIVHRAVGGITESDLRLAATSDSVILAFNVRMGRGLEEMAERMGVPVKYFSVIYDMVDNVKAMMAGKLPPIQTEVVLGHAEVRQTIRVPKVGVVAGTAVLDGKIVRNSQLRLIREDVVIFQGKVGSLRRFKDDVKEVATGYECGIGIEGCSDIKEGDVIEVFTIEETAATL